MSHIRATITTRDNVNLSKMTPSSSAVLAFGLLAASSSLRPSDAFQSFTVMPAAAPKVTSRSQTYSRRGEPIVKSRSLTAQSSRSSPLCFRRNTGILSMSTLEEVKSGNKRLMKGQSENSTNFVVYSDIPYFITPVEELDIAFANGLAKTQNNGDTSSDSVESNQNSSNIAGSVKIEERTLTDYQLEQQLQNLPPFVQKILDKVGKIDESRIVSSREYRDGEVPQLFSNIEYKTIQQPNQHGNGTTAIFTAQPSKTSFLSSSALLAGTALGSGLLTVPNAISPVTNALNGDYGPGFLTSLPATLVAWTYMTISALLTSELLINRCGETGKVRNVGLLELYQTYLGDIGGKVAGVGFLLVSYIMMGVYLSEGGDRLHDLLFLGTDASGDSMFLSRAIFAIVMGSFLSAASKYNVVQKIMIQFFVPATMLAFASGVSTALPTADLAAIWSLSNQHPEVVLNAFPLLFMSWTYHGVVPRVVYDLECNKKEITKAIVGGSTSALIMYVIWNAVMLGNVLGDGASAVSYAGVGGNPLTAIGDNSSSSSSLAYSVTLVTEMAAATSLIGVVLGFVNEFYDAVGTIPSRSYGPVEDNKWKVALLTLLPPALVSVALGYSDSITSSVDDVEIIEYAGAFGASTLFLILPALMAWQCRYGDDARPLTVRPMVPFGKIVLGSLYKAAGTLIVEQGLEKLGVFEFVQQNLLHTGQ